MANFKFAPLVTESILVSAALGSAANAKLTTKDAGKILKMGVAQNYVLAANGNDIEGTLISLEAHTVNEGFAFGSVKVDGMMEAKVDAAQTPALAIGAFVVAGTQTAIDTAGGAVVKGGAGVAFKWRIIQFITGAGAAGDTVLIQRV